MCFLFRFCPCIELLLFCRLSFGTFMPLVPLSLIYLPIPADLYVYFSYFQSFIFSCFFSLCYLSLYIILYSFLSPMISCIFLNLILSDATCCLFKFISCFAFVGSSVKQLK
ncbi:hypothetical protein HAX54_002721 [Datura stramonium]|uniref:NADH dehydrogenase subunit 6 n=1 Tax=Datura stramonium TaxID=4076 RepID=A0ABS8RTB4_DATST|nr:hypothetical protein [Datura stramonium]